MKLPDSNSGGSIGGSILGNYKFISIYSKTTSASQTRLGTDIEKTVTKSEYVTKNNTGTTIIGATTMTTANVSYSIDTLVDVYSYTNGMLTDSMQLPFQVTSPPSNGSAPYKMIGSDSAYFSSGFLSMGGSTQPTVALGAKLKMDGNKLYMTINTSQHNSQEVQGVTVITDSDVYSVITLQKL
ncbi:MAG TPA: hypothetical protein VGO09_08350 [Flavisolibacter sp.]|nr:hypothetical protein [Flavisolibacter sp.]